MSEMKSMRYEGYLYDSFVDKSAREKAAQALTAVETFKPRLLPVASNADTYKIVRVAMNGVGYELVPIEKDAYIENWILPYLLPRVAEGDDGKVMVVRGGAWVLAEASPTEEHIIDLINDALGVIENGAY